VATARALTGNPLPLMIVGEGTNEIQRNGIAAQLISRGGLDR
jgi:hypothetical protein